MPRVTAWICSYQHAPYLADTIESVLRQSFRDFELIIVEDGSSDGSLGIAQEYAARFPDRIRLLTHPGHANRGISASCNLAIQSARGGYLAWIGSDDVWYPEALMLMTKALERRSEAGFAYGHAHMIDAAGRPLPGIRGRDITRDRDPLHTMIQECRVPAMTVMIRREALNRSGLFDENLVSSDWELWMRIMSHDRVAFIPRPLARYRMHGANVSVGQPLDVDLTRRIEVLEALDRKAPALGGRLNRRRTRALIDLQLCRHIHRLRGGEAARPRLAAAFREDPSLSRACLFLARWLRDRDREEMKESGNAAPPEFASWLVDAIERHLGPVTGEALKRVLRGLPPARRTVRAFQAGRTREVWRNLIAGALIDPLLLADRVMLSIVRRILAGTRVS